MNQKGTYSPSEFSHILYETSELFIAHSYEVAWLIRKSDHKILFEGSFEGDPTCGLIDPKGQWAILAGEYLLLWTQHTQIPFESADFRNIYAVRQNNDRTVEILLDPWAEYAAIWELDLIHRKLSKVRDFTTYQGSPYTEKVNW